MSGLAALGVAGRLLAEKGERQRIARLIRARERKVQLNLRVSGDVSEILDAAAVRCGQTIDAFVERVIREACL